MLALVAVGVSLLFAVHGRSVLQAQVGKTWTGFPTLWNGTIGMVLGATPRLGSTLSELTPEQRVVAVDGRAIANGAQLQALVGSLPAGVPVRYTLETRGSRRTVTVVTQKFTRGDANRLYLPLAVVGVLFLAVCAAPILIRPDLPVAVPLFVVAFGGVTQFFFNGPDSYFTYRFVPYQLVFQLFFTAGLVHLGLVYPVPRWPLTVWPRATLVVLYTSIALFWATFAYLFTVLPVRVPWFEHASAALILGATLFLVTNILRACFVADPRIRRIARYSALMVVGYIPGTALLIADVWRLIDLQVPALVYALVPLLTVVVLVYATLVRNLFDYDAIVHRMLSVSILITAGLIVYLGVFGLLQTAGWETVESSAVFSALVLVLLLPAVPALSRSSEGWIERILFPERQTTRTSVLEMSRKLAYLNEPKRVVGLVRQGLSASLACKRLQVLIGDGGGAFEEVAPAPGVNRLMLKPSDELSALLTEGQTICRDLITHSDWSGPRRAASERSAELDVAMVVPFPLGSPRAGGLLLGERTDGRMYSNEDRMLLEILVAQVSVALENARAWAEVKSLSARLEQENHSLRQELGPSSDSTEMIGRSPAIRSVLAQLERAAPSDASVLLTGETGTGKEVGVRLLHRLSRRADGPFVKVASAAIPESLLESELFGYEKGAFTGADEPKIGRLESANGGTIFFDEVDTLPLAVQAKLLRAIQEGELQRLGSNEMQQVDLRIVCATNRSLAEEVREGRFREDLFYRLNVVPVHIPPLRERREDIPLLVQAFVEAEGPAMGREVTEVSADTMRELLDYAWPGNVRELRNTIQRALVMGEQGPTLRLAAPLGEGVGAASGSPYDSEALGAAPLAELVRRYKGRLIQEALAAADGNQRVAAAQLGMHRPSLTRMIRSLQLKGSDGDESK